MIEYTVTSDREVCLVNENVVSIQLKDGKENKPVLDEDREKILIRAQFDSKGICRVLTFCAFGIMLLSVFLITVLHYIVFVVCCLVAIVIASFGLYISNGTIRAKFYVTNRFVYSKTLFGSIQMVPVEKIEVVELSHMNSIIIKTRHNKITQHFIQNHDEIASKLRNMIVK